MTFLGFFLAGLFKDTAIAAFMMRRRAQRQQDDNLRRWIHRPKMPVVDWYLRRTMPRPCGSVHAVLARRIPRLVSMIRWAVNSASFETVITHMLASRFAPQPAAKPATRRWPIFKLVS